MKRGPGEVMREICLGFPETDERVSHGMANFRVRGKVFATYAVNHHGDGRVALWLPCNVEFDPLQAPSARAILGPLRSLCLALPEASEGLQFGRPAWRAGKKTFCTVARPGGRTCLHVWVGGEGQATLTIDPRYTVPGFIGRNGWISLDVESHADWDEIRERVLTSYRHFALKRMLAMLPETDAARDRR